jgi:hypothetical protein
MHPLVRDAYKKLLFAGRDYPGGLAVVRERAKAAFMANAHLTDELEIKKAVKGARYMARELYTVAAVKKYRALKKSYYD